MSEKQSLSAKLKEIAWLFFRLGIFGFGGPAAHIALMLEEFVEKRKWLERQHFLDLMGATNLIPGPNSTQMTMHVGYVRAGIPGLIVAGISFIFPAFLLTALLAWMYVTYGKTPQLKPLLNGMQPAILAIIAATLWKLAKTAVQTKTLAVIGLVVTGLAMMGYSVVIVLLSGTVLGGLLLLLLQRFDGGDSGDDSNNDEDSGSGDSENTGAGGTGVAGGLLVWWTSIRQSKAAMFPTLLSLDGSYIPPVSLVSIGWFFLKIGLVLYGSGYVLIAFLEHGLVKELKWLTSTELFHAIAIGQMTPGPVLTTATAVGWLVKGWSGAVVATVAIFLPSFVLVAILNPLIPKIRNSALLSSFLDSVNVCAVGVMAAVTLKLGWSVTGHWVNWVILVLAVGLRIRWKLHAIWLIVGGGVIGFFSNLILQ